MKLTRHRRGHAELITDARPSLDEQLAYRRRRYILTMAVRVVCLILAGVFYQIMWLALSLAVGAVILPWIAVVMANDRLPVESRRANRYAGSEERALPEANERGLPEGPGRTIDE